MKSSTIFTATALFGFTMAAVDGVGCYRSSTGTTFKDSDDYNSKGACGTACANSSAFATQLKRCFCGDMLPPDSDKVDMSNCDIKCPGYPLDNCGGKSFFYFYDAGVSSNIPKAEKSELASSSGTSPAATTAVKPSVVTLGSETVVVTSEALANSKPNVAGIAAGVVVGVVVIASCLGGLFMFMRNRKRRAIEDEHRRNAAINNFAKPPPSSSSSNSFQDTRLDPVMAHRRMSDGSIADNHDYSRKILKVTNA